MPSFEASTREKSSRESDGSRSGSPWFEDGRGSGDSPWFEDGRGSGDSPWFEDGRGSGDSPWFEDGGGGGDSPWFEGLVNEPDILPAVCLDGPANTSTHNTRI